VESLPVKGLGSNLFGEFGPENEKPEVGDRTAGLSGSEKAISSFIERLDEFEEGEVRLEESHERETVTGELLRGGGMLKGCARTS
jgi:hypothetical protein